MADNTLSKIDFLKGMKILSVLPQGNNPVDLNDRFTIEAWYGALNDLTDEQFQTAVVYCLRNLKWHPAPVDIREAAGFAVTAAKGKADTAEQQWKIFTGKISSMGFQAMFDVWCSTQPDAVTKVFSDPVTDAVAKTMAKEYGMSDISEAGNWRARFLKSYTDIKEHGVKTAEMQKIGGLLGLGNMSPNLKLVGRD